MKNSWTIFKNMNLSSIFDRRTLFCKTIGARKILVTDVTKALHNVGYVCTIIGIWSSKHWRFFGITVHWIDEDTYERRSLALPCRRFKSTRLFDRIAQKLQEIRVLYNKIFSKTVAIAIVDGANFFKQEIIPISRIHMYCVVYYKNVFNFGICYLVLKLVTLLKRKLE